MKGTRKDEILMFKEHGLSDKVIGEYYGISTQRVHQIRTGYISPSKITDINELKNWAERKRKAFPKEWVEEQQRRMQKIIDSKNHHIFTATKKEELGLPTKAIGLDGGRDNFREVIRLRDNHTCQMCGKKWEVGKRRFDVHHLDESMLGKTRHKNTPKYDRENFDKLITFCHKCHFKWHVDRGHRMSRYPLSTAL